MATVLARVRGTNALALYWQTMHAVYNQALARQYD
jgi:hypothetical protein